MIFLGCRNTMRSSLLPVPMVLLALGCSPQVRSLSAPIAVTDTYHALLTRLKARDTSINFTALRLSYAASADYAPYGSDADPHRDSVNAALRRQDYARAI